MLKRAPKILVVIIVLFSVSHANVAFGTEGPPLKPIERILNDESSEVIHHYVLTRCFALLTAISAKLKQRGPSLTAMADETMQKATRLGLLVFKVQPVEKVLKRAKEITQLYVERWNRNQNATGNQWGKLTMSDAKICNFIAEAKQ